MRDRERTWLWVSALVSLAVGSFAVMNDSGAGWFLIILGIVDIGASTRTAEGVAGANPRRLRWTLVGATLLLLLLAVISGQALLLR